MDAIEMPPSKPGFFKHMFELVDDDKSQLLNYLQYVLVALIPVVVILKVMRAYVPDDDEDKSTSIVTVEVIGQILAIFLSIWLVDRFVRFVPTYSGLPYQPMYLCNFVIAFLMILLTMQSKLGSKVDILVERVLDLWEGKNEEKDDKKEKRDKKVKTAFQKTDVNPQMKEDGLAILRAAAPQGEMPDMSRARPSPDFNNMYDNQITPMPGAASPMQNSFEPEAANGMQFGSMY